MFDRRLKLLLIAAGLVACVIVGRLIELQVVHAGYYRERAERSMRLRPRPLPFIRGAIVDRNGEVLVSDQACWDVTLDFRVIATDMANGSNAGGKASLKVAARRWRLAKRYAHARNDQEVEQAFRRELSAMWVDIARLTADVDPPFEVDPLSIPELRDRAARIYGGVMRIRRIVASRRGFDSPIAEETAAHSILTRLDANRQIAARELLAPYPWLQVEPSSARVHAANGEPFAHLLGRLGRVSAEVVANDPNADDPFVKYLANEQLGISGVEFAAEPLLRGRRGQVTMDRNRVVVPDGLVDAQDGASVALTIDARLQRRLYRLLGDTVDAIPESSGGAIVVLDVASREVLALVSYPSYDPNRFSELYPALRDDTQRLRLRFRTVANAYAPGSVVKPLVCMAGLMNGEITLGSREHCSGYLFDDVRNRWRCWRVHGTSVRKAHGSIDVVEALTGSCNVFMYRLGERLGVDRLCNAFDMAGIGRPSGIGLPEERTGINPTAGWLMTHRGTGVTPGTARLFAIGQGEILVTPVQVANLMAVYASGVYRPVKLILGGDTTPEWTLPVEPEHWLAIRRGVYGVVNDPSGTAYQQARFEHDRYALCGKTGSATVHPWPTAYRVPYVDEHGQASVTHIPAGNRNGAVERFRAEHPRATFDPADVEVSQRWPNTPPPDGTDYSHAWFGGFLQDLGPDGRPDWSVTARVAFAILVEFGGSGGRTSGPLARRVAGELVDVLRLDVYADDQVTEHRNP